MRHSLDTVLGRALVAAAAVLFVPFAAPALPLAQEEADESGSTYARLRFVDGRVTLSRTAEGERLEAGINTPIAPGDVLEVESGRAEMALADGNIVTLDEGARLEVQTLADLANRYEKTNLLALDQGSLRIDAVDPGSEGVFRVDTAAGSVTILSAGSIRIDVDGEITTVSSFRGVAEISGDTGSVLVRSGERTSVSAGRGPSAPRAFNTRRPDGFDLFCAERSAAYVREETADVADEEIEEEIPYEVRPYWNELSFHGSWRHVPAYGWVWRPVYYGAWGPYVNGYWNWYPSGWVWVSYDPWGWAPYRYGRWDHVGGIGWVWIPGRVWRGAWVSFAVGGSYVGWCPLNYYNRPVFHDVRVVNVIHLDAARLDARGWRFVPIGRFGDRGAGRLIVRSDRLPRGTDVVVTGRLPRFNPAETGARPERGRQFEQTVRSRRTPLPGGATDRPVPFRSLERGASEGKAPRGQGLGRAPAAAPRAVPAPAPEGEPGPETGPAKPPEES